MQDLGCVFIALAAIIVPAILYIRYRVGEEAAAIAVSRQRARQIVKLIERIDSAPAQKEEVVKELLVHLQAPPIGYLPELTGATRWFERAAPGLAALMRHPADVVVVEWFFSCFSFTAGNQQSVLSWLYDVMTKKRDVVPPQVLEGLVDRILPHGGSREAEWFYRRTLETLRQRRDDLPFRAFVLHVGRLSYAFSRPGRTPTIYDEQAIANDIAMCLA